MIIVQGASVLSHFKAQKLLHRMQEQDLSLSEVHAEQVYFIYGPSELSQSAQQRLEELLSGRVASSLTLQASQVLVIPRLGTISPWSSKATDIVHNCGFTAQ